MDMDSPLISQEAKKICQHINQQLGIRVYQKQQEYDRSIKNLYLRNIAGKKKKENEPT